MPHCRRVLTCLALAAWGIFAALLPLPSHATAPALLLAQVYRPGLDLQDYWVSEKYDGVRGYWDGRTLRTRGGETVKAPAWFTAGWPTTALDGELWAGRGQFAQAQSTTRRADAGDAAWHQIRFMVFDVPAHPGNFDQRFQGGQALVKGAAMCGQVEHHEAHGSPGCVVGQLLARGGLRMAEAPAPGPEFAVHGHLGPACSEPGGRCHGFAATGAQGVAIPESAYAVVLFAHPVVLQRQARAVDLRQQQGRGVCSQCRQSGQSRKNGERQQGEAASAVHGAI